MSAGYCLSPPSTTCPHTCANADRHLFARRAAPVFLDLCSSVLWRFPLRYLHGIVLPTLGTYHCHGTATPSSAIQLAPGEDNPPNNVLLVRGLHPDTSDEQLYNELKAVCPEVGSARIVRDREDGTSRCFCFVTCSSVEAATKLLDLIENDRKFTIDGRRVVGNFARDNQDRPAAANAAAQAAIAAAMAIKEASQGSHSRPVATPAPNPKDRLVLHEQSGFYYDSATGYYYDHNTDLFYDGTTGNYFSWNDQLGCFVPALSPAAAAAQTAAATAAKEKERKKKAKTIEAKKVAKDLLRWQKNQEKEKRLSELAQQQTQSPAATDTPSEAAAAVAAPDVSRTVDITAAIELNIPKMLLPCLDPWVLANECEMLNMAKMACMLCKRGLKSQEKLEQHVRESKLHQEMLEKKRAELAQTLTSEQQAVLEEIQRSLNYRDRAAERRQKYNQPEKAPPPPRVKRFKPVVAEQPTKDGIKEDNVGNKLLKLMGWKEGEGLGKEKQGIVEPVKAMKHVQGAGIGSAPVVDASQSGGSTSVYHEHVQKLAANARMMSNS
eukprot:m.109719 g.109719  ORF g.109719 m.109719 type:complete len:551 (-) comp9312_c0_seq3:27-1679(-)